MNTFKFFKADELKTMIRLVLGAHELATEPVLWKQHVLRGLCGLVEARGACWALLPDVRRRRRWAVLAKVDGVSGSGPHPRPLGGGGGGGWPADPMWEMARQKAELVTELRPHAGAEVYIYSILRFPQHSWATGLAVHQTRECKPFGERERVLVNAMHEELGGLYEREQRLATGRMKCEVGDH